MAHRYFTTEIQGDTARITGADAHHLSRVLRAKPGEQLTLCDGEGTDYLAEITTLSPDAISLHILQRFPTACEPSLPVEVYLAYAKGERMEWAVQKCVELGAAAIYPFYSANTVVQRGDEKREANKQQRLARVALEAAKQAGRGRIPKVGAPLTFEAVLAQATAQGPALFLYEKGGMSLQKAVQQPPALALISGAEGGFAPQESEAARAAGCRLVGLGPRILRCETAPVAALAIIMSLTGNLG